MKDREVILRYLAFKIFDYETKYQGDISNFLENAMKKINLMSDKKIYFLKNDFNRVMDFSFDFFENRNFRLPALNRRGRINIGIFESVSYFFSINSDDFLQTHKTKIQDNFCELLVKQEYIDAIRYSTSSKAKVIARFKLAQQILGNV